MARPLVDQIIARMLRKRAFLIALSNNPQAAIEDEFPGAWGELSFEEQQYFLNLNYQDIINSQDALDTELDPYSSSEFFFITD